MKRKMTSKEALKLAIRCSFFAQNNDELQEIYEAREKLEKDLDRLEKLEKENQELKQKLIILKRLLKLCKIHLNWIVHICLMIVN